MSIPIIGTLTSTNVIYLTDANDTFTVGAGDYVIDGLSGNDTITTGAGNSSVRTGVGSSTITMGAGNSFVSVGTGNNTITTGVGDSQVTAGNGNSTITTGAGNSRITTGVGNSTITAGAGNNIVKAAGGNNTVTTGAGNDIITTGGGSDLITAGAGDDVINAGGGSDTVIAAAGNDTLIYNLGDNIVGANDLYSGGSGLDTVQLQLTPLQWTDPAVRAELQRYVTFLAAVPRNTLGEVSNASANNFVFKFANGTTLTLQGMESLAVSVWNGVQYQPIDFHQTVLLSIAAQGVTEQPSASAQDLLLNGTLSFLDLDVGQSLAATAAILPTVVASPGVSLPGGLALALTPALTFGPAVTWTGGTRTIGYTYDPAAVNLDFLRAGQTLTVTYAVKVGDSAAQNLVVTINGTNDQTVLTSIAVQAVTEAGNASAQDLLLTGALSFTDLDVGDTLAAAVLGTPTVVASTGVSLPAALAAALAPALSFSANLTSNGGTQTIGYTYDPSAVNLNFLRAGQTLTVTYAVKVGDSTAQNLVVTITGTNDQTVLTSIAVQTVTEAGNASAQDLLLTGVLSFTDLDMGDTLAAAVVGTPTVVASTGVSLPAALAAALAPALSFSANLTSNGGTQTIGYSYDPTAVNLDFLRAGQTLTVTYAVKVGDSTAQNLVVTITGTNDQTVLTSIATQTVTEAGNASTQDLLLTGALSFIDLDIGDTLAAAVVGTPTVVASTGVSLPAALAAALAPALSFGANVTSNGGTQTIGYTYDPMAVNLDFLRAGQTLTVTYAVKAGDSAAQNLIVMITGTNDQTVLTSIAAQTVTEAGNASAQDLLLTGVLSFTDLDIGDTQAAAVVGTPTVVASTGVSLPAALAAALAPALSFSANLTSNGGTQTIGYSYDPTAVNLDFLRAGQTLTVTYAVKVGDSTAQNLVVTITGTNDSPVAVADVNAANEDTPLTGTVASNDSDIDDGAVLSYSLNAPVAGLTLASNGSYSFDAANAAYQHLAQGALTDVVSTYTVTDEQGASSASALTLTLTGTNDGPVALADTVNATEAGGVNNSMAGVNPAGNVLTNDTDIDTAHAALFVSALRTGAEAGSGTSGTVGSALAGSYGTLTLQANGSYLYSVDNANATVNGQQVGDAPLIDRFTYSVADGQGGIDSAELTISVNGANDAPLFNVVIMGAGLLDVSFSGDGAVQTDIHGLKLNDTGSDVVVQADGKIVMVGFTQGELGSEDFTVVRYLADGSLDTSFGGDGQVTTDLGSDSIDDAYSVATQADGKVVVAGYRAFGSIIDFGIVRYNNDGTLDTGFSDDGRQTVDFGGTDDLAFGVSVQADGKILVTGVSNSNFALTRLNADGSLDNSFDTDGQVTTDFSGGYDGGWEVATQADGKIVVSGFTYNTATSNYEFALARYNTNGSLDTSFDLDGKATVDFFAASGDDFGFGMALQADGKILVTGEVYNPTTGDTDFGVARFNADGSLDTSLDGDGKLTTSFTVGDNETSVDVVAQSDGKFVVAGSAYQGMTFDIARYNTDGSLDTSFSGDGLMRVDAGLSMNAAFSVAIQPDGNIVVGGYGWNYRTVLGYYEYRPGGVMFYDLGLVRVTGGSSSSSGPGLADQAVNQGAALSYVVPAGLFTDPDGDALTYSATRFNGTALPAWLSFNTATQTFSGTPAEADFGAFEVLVYATDPEGLLVSDVLTVTVTPVNQFAPVITSNHGGATAVLSVAENSATVTTVTATDADLPAPTLAYAITGGADAAKFSVNAATGVLAFVAAPDFEAPTDSGADSVYDVLVQVSDGALTDTQAIAVTVTAANHAPLLNAARIAAWLLDTSFSGDGKVQTDIGSADDFGHDVAVQADGKIVMAGDSRGSGSADFAVVRYLADGSLDTSFSGDGKVSTDFSANSEDFGYSVAIQSDGKVVVAGYTYSGSSDDFAVVRYNNNGTLDTSFNGDGRQTVDFGGAMDRAYSVSVQADGKIVVAGGSSNNFALARLNVDGSLDTSFDSDGRVTTDFSGRFDEGREVAIQADGKIVVSGRALSPDSNYDLAVVRYNINGSLDTSFDLDGKATVNRNGEVGVNIGYGMVLQGNGKILVTSEVFNATNEMRDFSVVRLNANGSLDTSFDGDGRLSTGFGAGFSARPYDIASQPDGKFVLAGYAVDRMDNSSFALARYNNNGSLDTSFSGDGLMTVDLGSGAEVAYSVAIQPDGNIVAGGYSFNASTGKSDFSLIRVTDGGLATQPFKQDAALSYVVPANLFIDPDGDVLTYSATRTDGSALPTWLSFNAATQTFSGTPAEADFGGLDVKVSATDPGGLSASDVFTINVIPVNQFAPVITSNGGGATATLSIPENRTTVTTMTATDADLPASTLSYAITGGADDYRFVVNAANGHLDFKTAPNFETRGDMGGNNVYDVIVQVSDGTLTDTQAIAVTVTPVSEFAPVITSNGGGRTAAISVAENATAVTRITAIDGDRPAPTLEYAITGVDAAKFAVNAATGALVFVTAPDFEAPTDSGANNVYDVTVQVSDGVWTDTQAIAVTVTPLNEFAPVITSNISYHVAENSRAVTTVTATDADLPAPRLAYAIIGGADAGKFTIGAATGALAFYGTPNYEAPTGYYGRNNSYEVRVRVSDGTLTDSQYMYVYVTPVNEFAPVITSNGGGATAAISVVENATAVTRTTASDADRPAPTLQYAITGGADAAKFSITTWSGELAFLSAPGFQAPTDNGADNVYDVIVQVSDLTWIDTQEIAVTVTATVTTVNEFAPVITSNGGGATAAISVAENTTAVATVTAADADLITPTFVYSIVGGADAAEFAVNAATGALAFVAAPEFQAPTDSGADNVYDVIVQVSDGTRIDTQAIAVTVTTANEFAPVITSNGGGATAAISVAENATAVATVTAADADLITPTFVYSIVGGADAAEFAVNAASGVLAFVAAPNFEAPTDSGADNVYDVSVQVSDGTRIDTQAFAVTVTPVNEFAPLLNPVIIAVGVLDTSFSDDGMVQTSIRGSGSDDLGYDVAVQANGKIVMAGTSQSAVGSVDFAAVRYLADGSLDTSFGIDGKVFTDFGAGSDDRGYSVAVQSDGKVLVVGQTGADFGIVRYNNDGTLDTGFSDDGKQTVDFDTRVDAAYGVSVQTDGKILVTGVSNNNLALARLNADGSLDTSFDADGRVTPDLSSRSTTSWEVATQADGKIVVSGFTYNFASGSDDFVVARYNTNGSPDTSFDLDGKATVDFSRDDNGYGMALQADGKILVTGKVYNPATGNSDFGVARFDSDGSLDTSFDGDGRLTTGFVAGQNEYSYDVAVQSDGKFVVTGTAFDGETFALARYNNDGSLDTSFSDDGLMTIDLGSGANIAYSVAIQPDGNIVAGGYSYNADIGNYNFGLIRVTGGSIIGLADQAVNQGAVLSYGVPVGLFTDADDDALTYSATSADGRALPPWLSFNAATQTFSGTPGAADYGVFGVLVNATDPGGLSASDVFTVSVNAQPVDIAWSAVGAAPGDSLPTGILATLSATDPDETVGFTFSLGSAAPANVFSISGNLLATTGMTAATTYTLALQVTDSGGASYSETFNVITGTNHTSGDTLPGGGVGNAGDDILYGLDSSAGNFDFLYGGSGNDKLVGQNGADNLDGGSGNDVLYGGNGNDALDGGLGHDTFVFDCAVTAANSDTISGFNATGTGADSDSIYLAASIYGSLSAGNFRANSTGNAEFADDRIVYETDTGAIYYDSDGFGGSDGTLVATLRPGILIGTLDWSDFTQTLSTGS